MRNALRVIACLLAVAACAPSAAAQCGPGGCLLPPPSRPSEPAERATPAAVRGAFASVVRVVHRSAGGASLGSGVIIGGGRRTAYVLTCAHLFDGPGATEVVRGSRRYAARVAALDRSHDLALLSVGSLPGPAAEPSDRVGAGPVTACGFGPSGVFRAVRGRVVGAATATGASAPSIRINGAVRSGDSGGPVFNDQGRVVAVVWGQRDGETYAMGGAPLRGLLERLPQAGAPAPIPRRPPGSSRDTSRVDPSPQQRPALGWDAGPRRAPRSEPGRPTPPGGEWVAADPPGTPRTWPLGGAWTPRVWAVLAAASGPTAIAALLAIRLWRETRARSTTRSATVTRAAGEPRPVAVDSPPPPQRVVPQTHYVSYENDQFALAHQWASEQLARKFPGSVELLTSLDSLIRQKLNGSAG
ncbi:serine protease [Botrimarina sp.]|uniref:S1 family peptidase n=1 Tax=Botrimarina sp. TaxID=2795802 RepID=UPI0032EC53CA